MVSTDREALLPRDLGIGRLFDMVRDAVIAAEASSGRIVLWNGAATAIFGYSAEEALGMAIEALVPERLRAAHRAGLAHYAASGSGKYIEASTLLELPALHRSGHEIIIEMTLSPLEEPTQEGRFALAIISAGLPSAARTSRSFQIYMLRWPTLRPFPYDGFKPFNGCFAFRRLSTSLARAGMARGRDGPRETPR